MPCSARPQRFLQACRGEATDRTPIWVMRQAGRYLPQYRALRRQHSMLEAIRDPETAAAITLQPVEEFDLDAAIIFSDILPPLIGMGLDLDFVPGHGPRLAHPLQSTAMIDRLRVPPATESMAGTLDAIRRVKPSLEARGLPLIGFAGAPFTLASYAIEGGVSRNFAKTKAMMYAEPAAWDRLMTKMAHMVADLLTEQAKAGADCLQVFDSWAGALGRLDYERRVQPYSRMLFTRLGSLDAPVIHFSTGTGAYLDAIAASGGDVVGVDWRIGLDEAWALVEGPIMGNLDPATLLAPWRELRPHIDDVLRRAGGRPGHIFNLGHGILPETPVDAVRRMVDYVHEADFSGPAPKH